MTVAAVLVLVAVATALAVVVRRTGWTAAAGAGRGTTAAPVHPAAPSADGRPAPAGPGPARRAGPEGPFVWARLLGLVAAVAVPLAGLAWVNSTTGFVWDDLKNLRQAQVWGLSLDYLMEPTSGHWAPGHRLADWALWHFFPMNVAAAQVITLAGFGVALLLFHRMVTQLARPGWGAILVTLLFGASVVNVGVTQWWASAMDRVPATVGSFLAIVAWIRFQRGRSRLWLVVSLAALAFAFCFYVKPVFVPLYLVMLRLLLIEPERPLRETLVATVREWPVWAAYAALTGLFALVYISTYPTELTVSPTGGMLREYFTTLWFEVLVPNLFGLYLPIDSTSVLVGAGVVLGQVLLALTVVVSVARWRPAWRAWAFFAVGLVANAGIIGMTRLGLFPVENIAYTLFYNLEITWLFFLSAGVAFFRHRPPRASPDPAGLRMAPLRTRIAPALLAVMLGAYLGLSWRGAAKVSEPKYWIGAQARDYLDRTAAGLRRIDPSRGNVVLVDGVVPENVVPYFLVSYNSDSEVLPLLDAAVSFDARHRSEIYDVGTDGTVRPVKFVPLAGGPAAPMLFSGRLGVVGARIEEAPGSDGFCIEPRGANASIVFVPPEPLVSGDGLYLEMRFTSARPATMSLPVETLEAPPPGRPRFRVVNLGRSGQETIYELDANTARQVAVVVSDGARFCLHHLYVGRVVARP